MRDVIINYIDDEIDYDVSSFLIDFCERQTKSDGINYIYNETNLNKEKNKESVMEKISNSNIVIIDSNLSGNAQIDGITSISGEEFRVILRLRYPYIRTITISSNRTEQKYNFISKYNREDILDEPAKYYEKVLAKTLQDSIVEINGDREVINDKIVSNENIGSQLKDDLVLSEKGVKEPRLTKEDIDELVKAVKALEEVSKK